MTKLPLIMSRTQMYQDFNKTDMYKHYTNCSDKCLSCVRVDVILSVLMGEHDNKTSLLKYWEDKQE